MAEFFIKTGNFLRRIRQSDDRAKKRWLIIFSAIGMALVIFLWVSYLSVTLPKNPEIASSSTEAAAAPSPEKGDSFFKTLGAGWESIWSDIRKNAGSFGGLMENQWQNISERMKSTNDLNLEKPGN